MLVVSFLYFYSATVGDVLIHCINMNLLIISPAGVFYCGPPFHFRATKFLLHDCPSFLWCLLYGRATEDWFGYLHKNQLQFTSVQPTWLFPSSHWHQHRHCASFHQAYKFSFPRYSHPAGFALYSYPFQFAFFWASNLFFRIFILGFKCSSSTSFKHAFPRPYSPYQFSLTYLSEPWIKSFNMDAWSWSPSAVCPTGAYEGSSEMVRGSGPLARRGKFCMCSEWLIDPAWWVL